MPRTPARVISLNKVVKAITDKEGGNLGEYIGVSALKDFINKDIVLGESYEFDIPGGGCVRQAFRQSPHLFPGVGNMVKKGKRMNDTEKVYAILIMLGLWGVVTFFMMIAWVFSEIERFKMMKRRWEAQDAFWEAQTAMREKRLSPELSETRYFAGRSIETFVGVLSELNSFHGTWTAWLKLEGGKKIECILDKAKVEAHYGECWNKRVYATGTAVYTGESLLPESLTITHIETLAPSTQVIDMRGSIAR